MLASKTAYYQDQRERSEVERLSRDCPFCAGHGMVSVYHPSLKSSSVGTTSDGRRFPATISAHCRCTAGCWIRERIPPELRARIPRVEDICLGRSRWLLIPPGAAHDTVFPDRPVTREDFARLTKRLPRPQKQTVAPVDAAVRARSEKTESSGQSSSTVSIALADKRNL
jgi:hypothetical protein